MPDTPRTPSRTVARSLGLVVAVACLALFCVPATGPASSAAQTGSAFDLDRNGTLDFFDVAAAMRSYDSADHLAFVADSVDRRGGSGTLERTPQPLTELRTAAGSAVAPHRDHTSTPAAQASGGCDTPHTLLFVCGTGSSSDSGRHPFVPIPARGPPIVG